MGIITDRTQQEYTPLDAALVRAIVTDFDVTKPEQLQSLRELLDQLRASAIEEESSGFDASGTSAHAAIGDSPSSQRKGTNSNYETASLSADTESTSISAGLSGLSLESGSGSGSDSPADSRALDEYANFDNDSKISILAELFPTLKLPDIAYRLKKSNNDISKAMDILLNEVFFEETAMSPNGDAINTRGVEAFSEDQALRRGRKKKAKGRKFQSLDAYSYSPGESEAAPSNKWEAANNDVTFISSRVNMPYNTIAPIYRRNGASRSSAILALVEDVERESVVIEEDQLSEDVIILSQDFPTLSFERCAALIQLSKPSTANAHELAKALTTSSNSSNSSRGPIALVPQYAPLVISDASPPSSVTSSTSHISGSSTTLFNARSNAFDKASHYHRMGKSNHLMGGAAAYYASQGRDYHTALKNATASEADAHVSLQSTSTQLDLHGVTVKDGTRIALQRVQTWWDNLGEKRIRGGGRTGVGSGYRIVTGAGRHSAGGVGKLGPAVMKVLLREGWKIEVGSGVLTVTGKMKR